MRQVVHALKFVAARHHQFASGKQGLQPALLVFPAPPACGFTVSPLEIARLHRTLRLNVRQQGVKFGTLFGMARLAFGDAPMPARLLVIGSVQRQIINRCKAGFVGPCFEHMRVRQGLVQPCGRVVAQTREQHQVRTARHHMDGVDLQQLHALDAAAQRQRCGRARGRREQPLCGEMQVARLLKCDLWCDMRLDLARALGSVPGPGLARGVWLDGRR